MKYKPNCLYIYCMLNNSCSEYFKCMADVELNIIIVLAIACKS
ncbi:30117_t:CDS:2 [Gigaspora margarita]|uniref:30117_t:CDS:1 n=1 Tax=Gigaspora margarita TaxID=4874 RepID=A0ABN7UIJ9_GIGMA|nr:30117_t:CDS:2 [Gigaspora margarita]